MISGTDNTASSTQTQQRLGWQPTQQPGLIDDLDPANVFAG